MKRARPEQQIQRAVFQHLRARGAPGVFAFHCPNGGWRSKHEAAIFKGLGVVAGMPDIIAIHRGRVFGLELKREGARASKEQLACLHAMEAAGAFCCIADSLDLALVVLERWGLLRGRAQVHAGEAPGPSTLAADMNSRASASRRGEPAPAFAEASAGRPAYDAEDDFAKSIDEAYRIIRERKAAGGEGWEPK